MYKVRIGEYGNLLKRTFEKKSPLYVYGPPGVGKSEVPVQVFSEYAKNLKKEFVLWSDVSLEQKKKMITNPEPYFVFCDQRVAQMDVTDLRGIPNMINAEMLETIPMSWVIYFTQPKACGCIFFDELNLAAPTVAGQAYQIINDRVVADRRLGDGVFVFGAGNRLNDKAYVYDMPFPLRDRFNEVELEPDSQAWVSWASGKVNPHLIAFINWKESYLFHVEENQACKSSTPRGIVRASKLIGDADITSNETHMYVSIAVGESFATQFQAYCKHFKALDWNKIFNDPSSIEKFEVDKLWAVAGGLAEKFGKLTTGKESQTNYDTYMKVVLAMPHDDFAVVSMRMMMDSDTKKFTGFMKKCPSYKTIANRYSKFIID